MNEQQFKEITEWQKQTFPKASALSKIAHLKEEIDELSIDVGIDAVDKILEFADCFLLLFGAAASDGMTYQDICQAIQEKFEINKGRKWGNPDENGVVKHQK